MDISPDVENLVDMPVEPGERGIMVKALTAEGLPTCDIDSSDGKFFAFRDSGGAIVGFAGLEVFGDCALLRSIVVLPARRRRGCGAAILERMVARARALGVKTLCLLTTTAAPFFARHGFRKIPRENAPASIKGTTEFSSLCPSAAEFMEHRLDGR
jgi:N-acetylglutamate synthase-like GNAT family acetyltransferase